MDIIKKIDLYFKKQDKKIKKINLDNNYLLKFDKNNNNLLYFYHGNEKHYTTKYIFYGIINKQMEFIWNKYIYMFNNVSMINIVEEIRNNKDLFKNLKSERGFFYYNLLNNDKIKLNSSKEIEWLNKLLLYMNKDEGYINPINSNNYSLIIGINKIKEQYI
jgi:hypothetical protein